jgi:hypothetical protein
MTILLKYILSYVTFCDELFQRKMLKAVFGLYAVTVDHKPKPNSVDNTNHIEMCLVVSEMKLVDGQTAGLSGS